MYGLIIDISPVELWKFGVLGIGIGRLYGVY